MRIGRPWTEKRTLANSQDKERATLTMNYGRLTTIRNRSAKFVRADESVPDPIVTSAVVSHWSRRRHLNSI
jgi:hypothetical protein